MKRVQSIVLALLLLVTLIPKARAYGTGVVGEHNIISAGNSHTAIVDKDGALWIAKSTTDGVFVKVMDNILSVSAGSGVTAVIKDDHSLWIWGENDCGQLGNGTTTQHDSPIKIMDNVDTVSLGNSCSSAIKTDGSLWMWGLNTFGQLGFEGGNATGPRDIICQTLPVKVMDSVMSVSIGGCTAALKSDGTLWTWGSNFNGEVGDGTTKQRHTPIQVLDDVIAVNSAGSHTAAIKTDGSLWSWGGNHYGQLGDGTTLSRYSPAKVMDNVAMVSGGSYYTAILKKDGTLWTCGGNINGTAGDGTTKDKTKPVQTMHNVSSFSAGTSHIIAIQSDGSLWSWGSNYAGQLGNGGIGNDTQTWLGGGDPNNVSTNPIQTIPYQLATVHMPLPIRLELCGGRGATILWATEGTLLTPSANPTKRGYSFAGWYANEALTKPWNFNTDTAKPGQILYAKWAPLSSSDEIATKGSTPVTLDGKSVILGTYTLKDAKGNEINYVKLRDIAALLDGTAAQCNVDWKNGAIRVTTGAAYTTPNGKELTDVVAAVKTYTVNTAPVIIDGYTKPLEGIVLKDAKGGGHTFFKLRDLGAALGFDVGWDGATGTILINTSK